VTHSAITGSAKDGIVANGLVGQPVTITHDTVTGAGTYGIRLVGADLVTLTDNTISSNGMAVPKYPAIYLSGVTGDFQNGITRNSGVGNGLDATVFHGIANAGLNWLTAKSGASALGYLLDGDLTVNGPFNSNTGDVVKSLNGKITINGAVQSAGSTFTSFKDDSAGMPACASVFVTVACSATGSPGDWNGIAVNGGPTALTGRGHPGRVDRLELERNRERCSVRPQRPHRRCDRPDQQQRECLHRRHDHQCRGQRRQSCRSVRDVRSRRLYRNRRQWRRQLCHQDLWRERTGGDRMFLDPR